MAKLNIDGVKINVSDDFLKMPPAEQDDFVKNIIMTSPEYRAAKGGASAAPATQRGYGETFGRAAAQGATFNFGDEIAGVREAAPKLHIPLINKDVEIPDFVGPIPARAIAGGVRLASEYFNPPNRTLSDVVADRPAATPAYDDYAKARDEFRTAVKEGAQQNPITSTVGNVTGALATAALPGGQAALPAKAFGLAKTVGLTAKEIARREFAKRVAEGGATGVAAGALSGVGEGENLEDRLTKGAVGSVIGGVVGSAAPAVLTGIGAAASPIASKIANTVRGYRDPEAEAARRLATTIERDIKVDPNAENRLTNAEAAQSMQGGGPATLMDLGGESTRALARSAANQSPEGRTILNQTINDRFEGQTPRVTDWLRNTFHFPDAEAQSAALAQTAKTVNKPAYAKAYSEGAGIPFNETLEQISQAPEVQGAIRKAMVNAKSEAAKMGFTPPKNPFEFDQVTGRLRLRPLSAEEANARGLTPGSSMTPNLQFWDIVKRNLDQGDRNSQSWAKILRDHLDELVPSYQQARAGAAHFFDADNALQAGQNFVGKNMTSGEARSALAKMSDTERQLFQDGFVSKYVDTLNQVGDRRSILNKIGESPAAREKLNIALGPEKATQLEAHMRVEGIMDYARRAVTGNSTTARQLAELGLAGTGAGVGGYLSSGDVNPIGSPGAVISGLLTLASTRTGARIEGNVARKLADLLVSKNPADLQKGVDIIRKSPRMMETLRGADKYIARVAGEEGSGTGGNPNDPKRIYITGKP